MKIVEFQLTFLYFIKFTFLAALVAHLLQQIITKMCPALLQIKSQNPIILSA